MPVLSLHNTYTLPSGSASYTLGLSGAPGVASYSLPTASGATGLGLGGLGTSSGLIGTSGLLGGAGSSAYGLSGTGGLSGLGTGLSGLSGLGGTTGLSHLGMSSTLPPNLTGLGTNTSYSTYANPLLTSGVTSKLNRAYDDLDLALARHRATTSPLSPIPPWDMDRYGLETINPSYMHSQSRPLSRIGIDLDSK